MQDGVVHSGHKVVILFEGRDAAGKGGVIKRIAQRLNCIAHLLGQIPYAEVTHAPVELPQRVRHEDYTRNPVPQSIIVPGRY